MKNKSNWIKCPKCGQFKMKKGYTQCYECTNKNTSYKKKLNRTQVQVSNLKKKNGELKSVKQKLNKIDIDYVGRITKLTDRNKFLEEENIQLKKDIELKDKSIEAFRKKFLSEINK